jgi:CO/xanthine dehydrogenase Mo-binding subunit
VEVLIDTGAVNILDYVVVHDCGTVINPSIVDGQIRGGVTQGIAGALHEAILYDDTGQLLTGTLMDYRVPKATQIPKIRTEHLESPDPTVPLGVKGVGESGTIGAPAAIANAVADALAPFGVRIVRTGLTPPVVLDLINQACRPAKKSA